MGCEWRGAAAPAQLNALSLRVHRLWLRVLKTVYVHVKNPEDQEALMNVRKVCGLFPGLCDMILVLGPDKQSAIKMPFRVDGSDELIGRLVKILGEDAVALK